MKKGSTITRLFIIFLALSFLSGCGGGGGGDKKSTDTSGEDAVKPEGTVTFTYTLDPGLINSLPAEANYLQVILDDKIISTVEITSRIIIYPDSQASAEEAAPELVFDVSPGDHTFMVKALKDTDELEPVIGPISFEKKKEIPLTIPISFAFPAFDYYVTNSADFSSASLEAYGTDGRDRIVQYGGSGDDLIKARGFNGNDWIEQYGYSGNNTLWAEAGSGDAYLYQKGGDGWSTLTAITSGETTGDKTFILEGGSGDNTLKVDISGNAGSSHIELYGGPSDNIMLVTGSKGDDTVYLYGGEGKDAMTYTMTSGSDTVTAWGDSESDALTINRGSQADYTVKDGNGAILYQAGSGGTSITVIGITSIKLL
jgi:hypothetical protein